MKVKTNLRAGRQNRRSDDTVAEDISGSSPVVYYPPVTRCVGI